MCVNAFLLHVLNNVHKNRKDLIAAETFCVHSVVSFLCVRYPLPPDIVGQSIVFSLSIHHVCPFVGQIFLPRYLMNGLSSVNETYREYSLALADDLIRFWMPKVKVPAGHRGGKGIHISAGVS